MQKSAFTTEHISIYIPFLHPLESLTAVGWVRFLPGASDLSHILVEVGCRCRGSRRKELRASDWCSGGSGSRFLHARRAARVNRAAAAALMASLSQLFACDAARDRDPRHRRVHFAKEESRKGLALCRRSPHLLFARRHRLIALFLAEAPMLGCVYRNASTYQLPNGAKERSHYTYAQQVQSAAPSHNLGYLHCTPPS